MYKYCFASLLLTGTLVASAFAAETPPPPPHHGGLAEPPPPPPPGERRRHPERDPGRRFRNGPGMWQVFSRLTPEERREMLKLQREDPEKFREVMSAKADELYKKRQQRRAELHKLAEQCRNAATPEEKERLKKQLIEEVRKDFLEHLEANRNQIADMKRRTAHLEKELQRREKNMDKAVDTIVGAMIRGEKPPRRPDSRRFDRKPLEK